MRHCFPLTTIRAGVSLAGNVRVLPDGETLRVRTRRPFPFEFRAYCVFDHERGHFVVTTIRAGRQQRDSWAPAQGFSRCESGRPR